LFQKDLFKDKIVLVTGGGSGIGYAISKMFLQLGAKVYIGSRKIDRIEKAVEELSQIGFCKGLSLDIRNREDVAASLNIITEESGRLDILINNAGGQFPSAAENISPNGWNAVINTNLNGTWNMTSMCFEKFFDTQKEGCIVNIIANMRNGFPGMTHTGAARAGVDNMTKSLSVEWARRGMRINAIAPGIIESSGLENYPPEFLQGITDKIPMQKLGTTDDIAYATLFLCSPMSTFITGETLYVDGGQRLWGDVWEYF
jgi:citronellol/citronellal dehydrogenase